MTGLRLCSPGQQMSGPITTSQAGSVDDFGLLFFYKFAEIVGLRRGVDRKGFPAILA